MHQQRGPRGPSSRAAAGRRILIAALLALTASSSCSARPLRAEGPSPQQEQRRSLLADIVGTDANDRLHGTPLSDAIDGKEGDDMLYGKLGDDTLVGGSGNGLLDGGKGADQMHGGPGSDRYVVDSTSDVVVEAPGEGKADKVTLSSQQPRLAQYALPPNVDDLDGSSGSEALAGNELSNKIRGGNGEDVISGGDGNDDLDGGVGNDKVFGNEGNDELDGGQGDDQLAGEEGDDGLDGNDGNDELAGGPGNDRIDGGAGDDVLDGGPGFNTMEGSFGDDVIHGGFEADTVFGSEGDDTIEGGGGNDRLDGGLNNDIINGGAGNDLIEGGEGQDKIMGGPGDDIIIYSKGDLADISIDGGDGTDILCLEGATSDFTVLLGDTVQDLSASGGVLLVPPGAQLRVFEGRPGAGKPILQAPKARLGGRKRAVGPAPTILGIEVVRITDSAEVTSCRAGTGTAR